MKGIMMKETDYILSLLEDELLRFIYQKRTEYYETGNFETINAIVDRCLPGARVEKEMLERIKDKNV